MFDKILIANRGEIACRVARTCRRLGVRTVAVYSEADVEARHVKLCDEAWLLGPAPARESYLRGDTILDIVRRSGAQAIHPGYGFLSENAEFARACHSAERVFIGPPVKAIEAMGSKSAAKEIMERAGVPLVPGYHGDEQSAAVLAAAAEDIGYPVLIKASAGGGGKGMRRVDDPAHFARELSSAQREARSAFGDDRVLVEKYLLAPRHIEVQVFADHHGHAVHLFERDCSIQRRHQKVIEEAPAPGMNSTMRAQMGETALAAARAIDYVGAGTVEFIVDRGGNFYFMEMNTRLQVEHPVTEMITGQDLVEWQLRVATGEPLPCTQAELSIEGHAFEARVYAEDPDRDFLPATGILSHYRPPEESVYVRVDTGVNQGDQVGIHYDPMIAKLVVWDRDRDNALRRLRSALIEFQVTGVTTNLAFLSALASHPAFAEARVDTGFIERHRAQLFGERIPADARTLAVAALSELLRIDTAAAETAALSADPYSPWHSSSGWRLNGDNHHTLAFLDGELTHSVTAHYRDDHYQLDLSGESMCAAAVALSPECMRIDLDGVRTTVTVVRDAAQITVISDGRNHSLILCDPLAQGMDEAVADDRVIAPMPGSIIDVPVQAGQTVQLGDPLMILEAMKMEHTLSAPFSGVVEEIHFRIGDQVEEGTELVTMVRSDA